MITTKEYDINTRKREDKTEANFSKGTIPGSPSDCISKNGAGVCCCHTFQAAIRL
jgi:hypothetical protein